ncbi:MAG: porin [Halioglobus sp.]
MKVYVILLGLFWAPFGATDDAGPTEQPPAEQPQQPEERSVGTLLDDETTVEMHDDTTLLRDVRSGGIKGSGLLVFDAFRFWVGGAIQYDYYNFDGIYNSSSEGARREGGSMRRFEGILRSQLYDWGEIKAQYDFDRGNFRDLYLRWVSKRKDTPLTITAGNQKEPLGLDNLIGNKSGIAQERSAPSYAFGSRRSLGVRLHKAFELAPEKRKFDYWKEDVAYMTTSVGVFTSDLDDTHDTDIAVTGRVTAGRVKQGTGTHVGISTSYREGQYYRVSMRPEVNEADRVTLAQPDGNTLGLLAFEAAYNRGPLHIQAEAYTASYRGRVRGYGVGGYVQGGWYLTGESRTYQPRWGVLAPHAPSRNYAVEIFTRLSHTRGDDEINGWNDFKSLTLGGNLYYRKLRFSANVLYGESREPIITESDGIAVNLRVQYLL